MIRSDINYNNQIHSALLQLPEEIFAEVVDHLPDLSSLAALKRSCQKANILINRDLPYKAKIASRLVTKLFATTDDAEFQQRLTRIKTTRCAITVEITAASSPRLQQLHDRFPGVRILRIGHETAFGENELLLLPRFLHLESLEISATKGQPRTISVSALAHATLQKLVIQGTQDVQDADFQTMQQRLPKLSWLELDGCSNVSAALTTTLSVCKLQGMRHTTASFFATLFRKELCVDNSSEIAPDAFATAKYSSKLKSASFANTNLTYAGLEKLFKEAHELETLNISGCKQLTSKDFWLLNWPKTLRSVTCDNTALDNMGFKHLVALCPRLERISLESCEHLKNDTLYATELPSTLQTLQSPRTQAPPVEYFEQLEKETTANATMQAHYAYALWDKKKNSAAKEKATQLLEHCLALCPNYLPALKLQAHLWKCELDKKDHVIALLERILVLEPQNSYISSQLVQLETKL